MHDVIEAATATELYKLAIERIVNHGQLVRPRGQDTRELRGMTFRLTNPNANVINNHGRGLNHSFGVAEWLWIMTGSALKDAILPFNKGLSMALGSPEDHTFTGAYGPKWIEQLPYVVENLRADSDSRQAVVNIWRDRPRSSKDTPCTLDWQFFVRDGRLDMHARMRSNDVMLGFPYDIFNFTQIQRWLAAELGVQVGEYVHFVGSFHLYERDLVKAIASVEDVSMIPPWQAAMTASRPSLALLQELLLAMARVKQSIDSLTPLEVEMAMAPYNNALSSYGPLWWSLPALLLSSHKDSRKRFIADRRFNSTPWATIFSEPSE